MFGFDWANGYVSPFFSQDGAAFATPDAAIESLLDLVSKSNTKKSKENSLIIDLGSGDGRIILAAARRGLRAHGVELDGNLVASARQQALAEGIENFVTCENSSLLDAELPTHADLVAYLLPSALSKLAARLATLKHQGRLFTIRWSVDPSCDTLVLHARHQLVEVPTSSTAPESRGSSQQGASAPWVAYEYHRRPSSPAPSVPSDAHITVLRKRAPSTSPRLRPCMNCPAHIAASKLPDDDSLEWGLLEADLFS